MINTIMQHLSGVFTGGALVGGGYLLHMFQPAIKAKVLALSQVAIKAGYKYVFSLAEIVPANLAPADAEFVKARQREIIRCAVQIEEVLLPADGLGAQKKANVIAGIKVKKC
jgi:hypothetical protein